MSFWTSKRPKSVGFFHVERTSENDVIEVGKGPELDQKMTLSVLYKDVIF
jgi:hypothetical protein